jgi:hypothetical protein
MWPETIATSARRERLAGRLVTGPVAFLLAGLLDLALLLGWLVRHRHRGRLY